MTIRECLKPAALACLLALTSACGGGGSGGSTPPPGGGNNPPPPPGGGNPPPPPPADTKPDAFAFQPVSNLFMQMTVTSEAVRISGMDAPADIAVTNGEYAINNQPFTAAPGKISAGDSVRMRATSAAEAEQTVNAVLDIGGVKGAYALTTGPVVNFADIDPDPFQLAEPASVEKGKLVTSDIITVTGINAPAPISITGGDYRIENGEFTGEPGTVLPGQRVQVRATAPATDGAVAVVTLRIGGVAETFVLVTPPADGQTDTVPDLFGFTPVLDAEPGMDVESASVTISGLSADAPISIDGGEYSLGAGFTDADGTVANGNIVTLRVRSAASSGGVRSARVNIGGVRAYFTVITREISFGSDTAPDANSFLFDPVETTTLGVEVESDWRTPAGFDAPAEVGIDGGEYRIEAGGYASEPRLMLPGQRVQVRGVSPAVAGEAQTVSLTIGGVASDFVINAIAPDTGDNQPPVIEATVDNCVRDISGVCVIDNGAYHVSFESDGIILDATGSSDPDGDELSIEWTIMQGEEGIDELVTEDVGGNDLPVGYVGAVFNASGEYVFRVAVSDGQVSVFEDLTVVVDPASEPPQIDIGHVAVNDFGTFFQLDASGVPSDDDNDGLTFSDIHWTQVSGPQGSDELDIVPRDDEMGFATADYTDRGVYTFGLHIELASGETFVFEFVVDASEPSVAGVAISAGSGTITLRGQRVYSDNEDYVTDVQWEFIGGPDGSNPLIIEEDQDNPGNATSTYLIAGNYQFKLLVTVRDGQGVEKVYEFPYSVDAPALPVDPPTAVIDVLTASPAVGELVELDGSRSSDVGGGVVNSFAWTVYDPGGAESASGNGQTMQFTPHIAGNWQIFLDVFDDSNNHDRAIIDLYIDYGPDVEAVLTVLTASPTLDQPVNLSAKDSVGVASGYSWFMVRRPGGSNAVIAVDPNDPSLASFTPDVLGDYEIELTVNSYNPDDPFDFVVGVVGVE